MAKYKVLVIGLSLKNNKVAKFGDIVVESQLSSDVESLVKGKYIELVDEKEVEEAESTENVEDVEVEEAEIVKPKKGAKK